MGKPKIIAFYLPQFHPTPDNEKWWGKGFTEWTNVGKAKPLFKGHYQPKVPADLGYYDLRLPQVREAQAELAKEAGIYGFCYYHYWFGNGKRELEIPFNEVLKTGKPDFPFMLCWANESWHKKFWDKDGNGSSKEILIEQTYPGKEDIISHFYEVLPAFKDPRYIKINNKPAFMIYKPFEYPDIKEFIKKWQELAKSENIPGIYFIAQNQDENSDTTYNQYINLGFDAVNTVGLYEARRRLLKKKGYKLKFILKKYLKKFKYMPFVDPYSLISKKLYLDKDKRENIFPTLIPNWDHTPRSSNNGWVLKGSTPEKFAKQIKIVLDIIKNKKNKIIFLKSWNEWGEGNYMEPDLKFGKGYIKALAEGLKDFDN